MKSKQIAYGVLGVFALTGLVAGFKTIHAQFLAEKIPSYVVYTQDLIDLETENESLRLQAEEIKSKIQYNSDKWHVKRCLKEMELKDARQDYDESVYKKCTNPTQVAVGKYDQL